MSCFLRTVASTWTWQDEAELVVATIRAGLAEKGKAWLQQEVAAKAQPQLCALARQLNVRQRVAGGKVTKADLAAAAVVEQLCGQVGSKAAQSCVFPKAWRRVLPLDSLEFELFS